MLEDILSSGFETMALPFEELTLKRYRAYFEYLEEMNSVMNLTAISGETDVARLHFLDSAVLLTLEDFAGKSVIDVGTGAGFPGLPLKIAQPDISLTLLDSLDKRIVFLRQLCEKLGFDDTECIHARAEEAPEKFRENFDIAVSRAVARLSILCELCIPFVKPGGIFISMKGSDCQDELNEAGHCISVMGGRIDGKIDYTIPGTDIKHSAVIIRKISSTSAKYPRRWAQIKKNPLL